MMQTTTGYGRRLLPDFMKIIIIYDTSALLLLLLPFAYAFLQQHHVVQHGSSSCASCLYVPAATERHDRQPLYAWSSPSRPRPTRSLYATTAAAALAATTESASSPALAFDYIDDRKSFLETCEHLAKCDTLGVDLEGEFNRNRYGIHLCLVQVHNGTHIFLIDPLTVGPLDPLLDLLEAPTINIVAQDPRSDFILLDYLYGCRPRNIFDTQSAAALTGHAGGTSLGALLTQYFDGVTKNTKLSSADWNVRPISSPMLEYAALDVAYLHPLKERLQHELRRKNRESWHEEECLALEDVRYRPKDDPHLKIKGARYLTWEAKHVLKHLFEVRDRIARQMDKPPYYVINNQKMVDLAQEPPTSTLR